MTTRNTREKSENHTSNVVTDEQVPGKICIIPRSLQGIQMTICTCKAGLPESNLYYPFCSPVWPRAAAANPLIELQPHKPVDPE
jgi:hypothetical protein